MIALRRDHPSPIVAAWPAAADDASTMALCISSEETATAQVVWAGEIPAACYGPLLPTFESRSVSTPPRMPGSGARKKPAQRY